MYAKKKSVSMKVVVLMMALVLLVGCTIGGTLAWLAMKTAPVVNTFTAGKVEITLAETTGSSITMVPGVTSAKDPKVTVKGGSENCWVFVKIDESNNVADFIDYGVRSDWTKLEAGVYYLEYTSQTADKEVYVLTGDTTYANGCVTVKEEITRDAMNAITSNPQLTFTAYAVQKEGFANAAAAWAHAQTLS